MRIQLIVGSKGTGKTKRFTKMINQRTSATNGSVVCIEKGDVSRFEVTHKARLIDVDEYKIAGSDELFGMICGLTASNYDITDIFVDATFRIIGTKSQKIIRELIEHLCLVETDVAITMTISCDAKELDKSLVQYII